MQKEIREIIDELQEKMLEGTFVRNANEYMEIFTTLKGIVEDPTFCNYRKKDIKNKGVDKLIREYNDHEETQLDRLAEHCLWGRKQNRETIQRKGFDAQMNEYSDAVRRNIRQIYAEEIYKSGESVQNIVDRLRMAYLVYTAKVYVYLNDNWIKCLDYNSPRRTDLENNMDIMNRLLRSHTETNARINQELKTTNLLTKELVTKWDEIEDVTYGFGREEYINFAHEFKQIFCCRIRNYRRIFWDLSVRKTENQILDNCFQINGKIIAEIQLSELWKDIILYCLKNDIPLEQLLNPKQVYYGEECARPIKEVDGKPDSFADIVPMDSINIKYESVRERKEAVDERYKVLIREGIGFDRCCFNCIIERIDMDKLLTAAKEKKKLKKNIKEEWITINYGSSSTRKYILTGTPGANNDLIKKQKWTMVKVQLSPYEILTIKLNNTAKDEKTESTKGKELTQLEIRVRPSDSWIGNWNNYTLEELRSAVSLAIRKLEDYGIYINKDAVIFHSAEVNNTFAFSAEFNALFRYLKYYQEFFPNKSYTHGVFLIQGDKEEVNSNIFIGKNTEETYDGMTITGLESVSRKTKIKIYEKRRETENKHGVTIDPVSNNLFLRLEFEFCTERSIKNYFKYLFPKGTSEYKNTEIYSLYDGILTEESIKALYKIWVKKFFIDTFEKYCKVSNKQLEELVETQNYDDEYWMLDFQQNLLVSEIKDFHTPLIFMENDIDDVIRRIPKLQNEVDKYIQLYHEVTKRIVKNENGYELISQFIRTAMEEEGISREREITYIRYHKKEKEEEEEEE